MQEDRERVNQTKATHAGNDSGRKELRCKRCGKLLEAPERETYYTRTGMCFWCAYVDAQG